MNKYIYIYIYVYILFINIYIYECVGGVCVYGCV